MKSGKTCLSELCFPLLCVVFTSAPHREAKGAEAACGSGAHVLISLPSHCITPHDSHCFPQSLCFFLFRLDVNVFQVSFCVLRLSFISRLTLLLSSLLSACCHVNIHRQMLWNVDETGTLLDWVMANKRERDACRDLWICLLFWIEKSCVQSSVPLTL